MAELKKNTRKAAGTTQKAKRTRKTATPKKVEKNPEVEQPSEYTVKVGSFLRIRSGAGKEHSVVGRLENGEKVIVYEVENGFGRIGSGLWVDTSFLK